MSRRLTPDTAVNIVDERLGSCERGTVFGSGWVYFWAPAPARPKNQDFEALLSNSRFSLLRVLN